MTSTLLLAARGATGPHPSRHGLVHRAITGGAHLSRRIYHQVIELFHDRPYVPLGLVLICLAGSACYAISSVMQQREARQAPAEVTMRLGLLAHLLRRPKWVLGNLAGAAGFGLQFLALRTGSLALVQPLLVTGLVFALVGGAALDHRRLSRPEWLWTGLTMAGLVAFLLVAQPGPGDPRASLGSWLLLLLLTLFAVGSLVLAAHLRPRWRALCLGAGTGVLFGVAAALIESSAHLLDAGVLQGLAHWQPYALVVCAISGLVLSQSAFQAGELKWSLPALTVVEPPVAILIGQLLFSEHISFTGLAPVGEVLALLAMAAGVFGLARAEAPGAPADAPSDLQGHPRPAPQLSG